MVLRRQTMGKPIVKDSGGLGWRAEQAPSEKLVIIVINFIHVSPKGTSEFPGMERRARNPRKKQFNRFVRPEGATECIQRSIPNAHYNQNRR